MARRRRGVAIVVVVVVVVVSLVLDLLVLVLVVSRGGDEETGRRDRDDASESESERRVGNASGPTGIDTRCRRRWRRPCRRPRVGGGDDVERTAADAASEVEWDGKTYAGSRLEYAGVEARGELRWPIPLHALAEVNPDLKALLEVTRTSDGEEERRIANRLSVVESDADGGEGRREGVGVRRGVDLVVVSRGSVWVPFGSWSRAV